MPRNSVSIRIGTDGKATVIRDFDEIATAGGVSADRLRAKWEQQVSAIETATERANKTAQRLAAANVNPVQGQVNQSTGVTGGQGEAAALASALSLAREMQRAEDEARQLLAAIDPVIAAQMRYGAQVERLDQLHAVGALSEANYQRLLASEAALLDQVSVANSRRAQQEALGAEMAAAQAVQMERQQAAARALISAIDPLYAAQQRYNQQSALAFELFQAGALNGERYRQVMLGLAAEVDAATRGEVLHGRAVGGSSIAQMEMMHVVRGSADSYAAGMPPMMIFTQHLGMLAQAASYGGEQMGAFGRFMGGPYGLLVTAAVAVGGTLLAQLIQTGESVESLIEKKRHDAAQSALNAQADATWRNTLEGLTASINEQNHALAERLRLQSDVRDADLSTAQTHQQSLESDRNALLAEQAQLGPRIRRLQTQIADPDNADAALQSSELNAARQRWAELARQLNQVQVDLLNNADAISRAQIQRNQALDSAEGQIGDRFDHELGRLRERLMDHQISLEEEQAGERRIKDAREAATRAAQQAAEAERNLSSVRFSMPVSGPITSGFGVQRPGHSHAGLDIAVPVGTGIHADAPGTIIEIGNDPNGYGTFMIIDHGSGTTSRFGHLSRVIAQRGQRVEQGDIIALSGGARGAPGSGDATGPHVHYEVRRGGRAVDPRLGLFPVDPMNAGHGAISHEETLARENAARVVNTAGLWAEVDAYLRSSAAGATATAQREGLTAATRQGTDTDLRARQQLEQNIAQAAVTGAQHLAQLRDEAAARQAVDDQVAAGTLNARDMQRAMQDDAALRPMLILQAQAHGESLEKLNRVIDAYREGLRAAHEEEARSDFLANMARLNVANDNARAMLAFGGTDQERAIRQASLAAGQEAADRHYSPGQAVAFAASSADRERLNFAIQTADQVRRMNAEQDDRNALLAYELRLGRMGEQQRQDAVRIEGQRLQLERQFGPLHEAEIRQLLDKARAEQELQRHLQLLNASMQEVDQFGGQFIDEVLNVQNWSDWGAMGKRVLQELLQEMITLAAINPLKNMLLGQNNPTLSSVGGILGSLFGGGAGSAGVASAGSAVGAFDPIIGFAGGTDSAPGGVAWVGEQGPELMDVPRGARIIPAAESRRLAAGNDGGIGALNLTVHNDFRGSDMPSVSAISARIDRFEQEFPDRVVNAMANARSRFVWR